MQRDYQPPWFLFNGHIETIYPSLFREIGLIDFEQERISTPDDDFLDLFRLKKEYVKAVIISHGLEGNAHRAYVKGMAKAFFSNGFDVIAWNYRGCSDEMNRQLRFYHSGATDDLSTVVDYLRKSYNEIYLIGFSLGGNLTLKYLGEQGRTDKIKGGVAISTPMDLYNSCLKISEPSNRIYAQRFLRSLKKKIILKSELMNGIDAKGIEGLKTLIDFDDRYTGPLHGYKDAIDYYNQCSSIHFLDKIAIPTLVISAKNDPFLSLECFPQVNNPFIKTEFTERGGHVGFTAFNRNGLYWSEQRALDFILSL